MPSIKPISDLRNYTDVLKEVDARQRVYLTRNGHGAYAIMSIDEADELDRIKAMYRLLTDLKSAETEAESSGWIDADALEKEMETTLDEADRYAASTPDCMSHEDVFSGSRKR